MATETMNWQAAVEIVCDELEEFAVHRDAGHSVPETALAMEISPVTAEQYERTITLLLAALTTQNEAAPSPARLEVAPQQAHTNPIEGAIAP